MIKNSKCLVTGGNGFIGKYLCHKLESMKASEVRILEKELGGVTNLSLTLQSCQDIDYVFHLGSVSTVPTCASNQTWIHDVNVTGAFNVLMVSRACQVKRVVFASSSVVHDPRTVYAVTKAIGELYCKLFNSIYGLPVSVLRFYNVYGQGQESDTAVIPDFIKKIKAGKELMIEGTGEQTRDFVHVEDVVEAVIQVVEKDINGYYDIGTGIDVSINNLACIMGNIFKKPVHMRYIKGRLGDVDKSKANKPDWFKPKYNLIKGLEKTVRNWR